MGKIVKYALAAIIVAFVSPDMIASEILGWEDIVTQLRQVAGRTHSIQYTYVYKEEAEGAKRIMPNCYALRITDKMESGKFKKSTTRLASLPDSPTKFEEHPSREVAYNFVHFQLFDNARQFLALRERAVDTSFGDHYGVHRPFGFVLDLPDESYTTLQRKELWSKKFRGGEYVKDEAVRGQDCVVMDARLTEPVQNGAYKYRIHFAKNLDYYPLKYLSLPEKGDTPFIEFEVETFTVVDDPAGRIVVPLSMKEKWFGGKGTPSRTLTYEVDPNSLKVNHDIPDEEFTIPWKLAVNGVENIDRLNEPIFSLYHGWNGGSQKGWH